VRLVDPGAEIKNTQSNKSNRPGSPGFSLFHR
jgi:hypothetical protein